MFHNTVRFLDDDQRSEIIRITVSAEPPHEVEAALPGDSALVSTSILLPLGLRRK